MALAVLLLVLAMPKRDAVNSCIYRVALGLGLSYAHNCDSLHIARDARNLGRFLAEASPSRSRPVHILAVSATAHVLSPVLVPAAALLGPLKRWAGDLLPVYLAAVVVNAAVLALSYAALVKLVGAPRDAATGAALIGLLASYDVTVAWFWVPHQILMNVLAPLGAALAFVTGMRARLLSWQGLAGLGLATSAAALTYGYCLVWPLAFGLGALWAEAVARRLDPLGLARALLPYGLAFVGPILIWLGAFAVSGREVAYEAQSVGQFQWLGEAIAQRNLLAEMVWRAGRLAGIVAGYLGPWGWTLVAGAVAMLVTAARRVGHERPIATDPVVLGALVAGGLMLIFNYLQGYHQGRLLLFPLLLTQLALLRLLVVAGFERAVPVVAGTIVLVQVAGGFLGPPASME